MLLSARASASLRRIALRTRQQATVGGQAEGQTGQQRGDDDGVHDGGIDDDLEHGSSLGDALPDDKDRTLYHIL